MRRDPILTAFVIISLIATLSTLGVVALRLHEGTLEGWNLIWVFVAAANGLMLTADGEEAAP